VQCVGSREGVGDDGLGEAQRAAGLNETDVVDRDFRERRFADSVERPAWLASSRCVRPVRRQRAAATLLPMTGCLFWGGPASRGEPKKSARKPEPEPVTARARGASWAGAALSGGPRERAGRTGSGLKGGLAAPGTRVDVARERPQPRHQNVTAE
jgi:hypothetical protein